MKESSSKTSQMPPRKQIEYSKFNKNSKPLSIDQMPSGTLWKNLEMMIKSLEISEQGQTGVIFIEITEGSFVLKPCVHTPSDVFFQKLASMLGLKVPAMSYFSFEDPIYETIYTALKNYCLLKNEESLMARLQSRLNFFLYEIIEYIPSVFLAHFGKERFSRNFAQNQNRLLQIGQCLAFDMLVNNNDRFQLIWSGDGNISNVLIEAIQLSHENAKDVYDRNDERIQFGNFVFIDNLGNMCDVGNPSIAQNVQFYFKKVSKFHGKMIEFLRCYQKNKEEEEKHNIGLQFLGSPQIIKLKNQLFMFTEYELGLTEIVSVMRGVAELTRNFLKLLKQKKISQLYEETFAQISKDGKKCRQTQDQWKNQLKNVSLLFCQKMCEVLSQFYPSQI